MTDAEKIALVKNIVDDSRATDALVGVYLHLAEEQMMDRLYPFGRGTQTEIPAQWQTLQCELAARLYLQRGAEGEIVHIENGVHRHYHSVSNEDLLGRLTPNCGFPGVVR